MADISKITVLDGTQYDIKDGSAISNITRSGTTFTATRRNGTSFTFTQQDNNTTYSAATQSAAGLMSASDKTKLDGIATGAKTGTVTSVAASGSGGITISGSPITTSGTLGIGLNLSTAINGLSEGSSTPTDSDYYVSQYAGGGTTTTTYHRRPVSALYAYIQAKTDTRYVKKAGDTMTGALNFANNVLNAVGDDASFGDVNSAGKIGIKGKNGATGFIFQPYSGSTSQTLSIDGAGTMSITGNYSVAGSIKTGDHVTQQYNATTEALDFIFS